MLSSVFRAYCPGAHFRHVVHRVYRAAASDRFRRAVPGEGCHVKTVVGCEPYQGYTYVLPKPVISNYSTYIGKCHVTIATPSDP
jgi:hypothetical protein